VKPGVTVVICTYNGASLLPATLRHLAHQQVRPDIPWQLIVVDNASSDDTSRVAKEEWRRYDTSAQFTLLHEPTPGLNHARTLGLTHAQFEYVLFCDDDNWLNPQYVRMAFDLMQQHPSIGVLGGCGELVYEAAPPAWAAALPLFANGPQEKKSGKVRLNAVYGAGCVLRKSVLASIMRAGFKPMLSDRKGAILSSGGDYEICYAFVLAGYDIWYDERLTFKHFMTANRQTWEYYGRFFKQRAQSFEVLLPYQIFIRYGSRNLWSFHFTLLRLFLSHIKSLLVLLIQRSSLPSESDTGKTNTLRLKAKVARIKSFTRYRFMKKNFLLILSYHQEVFNRLASTQKSLHSSVPIKD
jgi:glycosyltransferase involved in cell wall biosynthesis